MSDGRHSREYKDYLSSFAWHSRRIAALKSAGYKCEMCGQRKSSNVKLEVHHKTYSRFGCEQPCDLIVVCDICHIAADRDRQLEKARDIKNRRIDGWASKKYGENWQDYGNADAIVDEFYDWLEAKGYAI